MYIDFEFANKCLSDFGLIMCQMNTSAGLRQVKIGSDIKFTTIKNNHSSIHSITSSAYENVYTTTFEIMKNPCIKNVDDLYMTIDESRCITKWLNRRDYHKFTPFSNENYSLVHYYGSFNVSEIMIADRIAGLSLTFTSNAPYGFGEEIKIQTIVSTENQIIKIWGDGDELDVIYPVTSFRCFADGDLKITNLTTDNCVLIKNCVNGETIVMDGEHKIITSDKNHKNLYNDFNYNFFDIDISEYDGNENTYEVSIPCEITVTYIPIRKVGVM